MNKPNDVTAGKEMKRAVEKVSFCGFLYILLHVEYMTKGVSMKGTTYNILNITFDSATRTMNDEQLTNTKTAAVIIYKSVICLS